MGKKLTFLVGIGAGYVLGTRAGRERYDQMAAKAQQLWRNPRVQERSGQAQQLVKEKAGHATDVVKDKVTPTTSSSGDGSSGGQLP